MSLFDVVVCGQNVAHEIVKSIILKALIQIDRSKDKSDREITSQCIFFLKIEAKANRKNSAALMDFVNVLELL